MRQMLALPLRDETNAIVLPSGDQRGSLDDLSPRVSCRLADPSAAARWIWLTHSLRSPSITASPTTKATCVPSGDGTTAGTRLTVSVSSGVHDDGADCAAAGSAWSGQGRREDRGGDRANQQHSHTSSERFDAARSIDEPTPRDGARPPSARRRWPIAESAWLSSAVHAESATRGRPFRENAPADARSRSCAWVGVSASSPLRLVAPAARRGVPGVRPADRRRRRRPASGRRTRR